MQPSLPTNALDETPMHFTRPKQLVADTVRLPFRKPVSSAFHCYLVFPVRCQPLLADGDSQSDPSTETSSLISGPGDIIDDDDTTSKKPTHPCIDITGLALLYKPEFWQLWVLMGLLTGVGLMTIK